MDEFSMTGSLDALDRAVELDRQAVDSAQATGLQDRDPEAYLGTWIFYITRASRSLLAVTF